MKAWIKFSVKLLFGLALILLFFYQYQWKEMVGVLTSVRVPIVFASLLVQLLIVLVITFRWHLLLLAVGTQMAFRRELQLVLAGRFLNTFVPGSVAGDLFRSISLKKAARMSGPEGFSVVITDRIVGLLGLIFMALLGLLIGWKHVSEAGLEMYFVFSCAALVTLMVLLYSHTFHKKTKRFRLMLGKTGGRLEELHFNLRDCVKHRKTLLNCLGISLFIQFLMVLSSYLFALSLDASVPFTSFMLFIPFIYLISFLPISIGGLGVREASFVLLFPLVGMPETHAVGTSLLLSGTLVLISLLGGLVFCFTKISDNTHT